VTAALLLSALACASPGNTNGVTAKSAPQPTAPTALVTADTADVVISEPEGTTVVRVGQTVGVKSLAAGTPWQVSFSDRSLELLTPIDRLPAPGADGWVWKALAPGHTEITFTSTAPCPRPPCGPNVMQITVALEITGSL
jgi:hypothetical protein